MCFKYKLCLAKAVLAQCSVEQGTDAPKGMGRLSLQKRAKNNIKGLRIVCVNANELHNRDNFVCSYEFAYKNVLERKENTF